MCCNNYIPFNYSGIRVLKHNFGRISNAIDFWNVVHEYAFRMIPRLRGNEHEQPQLGENQGCVLPH